MAACNMKGAQPRALTPKNCPVGVCACVLWQFGLKAAMLIAGTPAARPAAAASCRHMLADSTRAPSYNFPQVCSGDLPGLQRYSHLLLQSPSLHAVSR